MLEDEKCLIGSPCSECIETCGYRKKKKMEMKVEAKEQTEQFPCDICEPPHMCGYCNLKEEWEKKHLKCEVKDKYTWD